MDTTTVRRGAKWLAGAAGVAAGAYATYAALTWLRYGKTPQAKPEEVDALLDRFMPEYEVVERHHVTVDAPADVTFTAATTLDMSRSLLPRALFRTRAMVLGETTTAPELPARLLDAMQAIGWKVLAEIPNAEIVFGAATKPWESTPEFRAIAPAEFASFDEPGYVKIAFTLRADVADDNTSIFRTETRACATDPESRAKFRRYWSLVSPGVALIRLSMLGPVKSSAERRARVERELATV